MNDQPEFRDLFVVEAQENLQALNAGTIRIERDPADASAVNDLFRAAHTVKGMAATMGYDGITQLCHVLEDAMDGIRSGTRAVSRPLIDALFAGIDAITNMVGDVASGSNGGEAPAALLARLESLAKGEAGVPLAPSLPPAMAAPGRPPAPAKLTLPEAPGLEGLPREDAGASAVALALQEGTPVVRLDIKLVPDCHFKGVRAMLLQRNLEKIGAVLASSPEGKDFEEGRFGEGFTLWIASQSPLEDLERRAAVESEVFSAKGTWVSTGDLAAQARAQMLELMPSDGAGQRAVEKAFADGADVALLHVSIDKACTFKGVRALLVRKALEKRGSILATDPAGKPFEEGAFGEGFRLWLASSAKIEDIQDAAARVMEVSSARTQWLPRPPTVPARPAEEATARVFIAAEGVDPAVGSALPEERRAQEIRAEPSAPGRQTLRVSVERLDKILNMVGELVTAKIRLGQIARAHPAKELSETLVQIEHIVNELQEEVTASRMVPMDQIFSRFPRLIRDLARDLDKPMDLVMEGRDIELDRTILDEVGEVLVHLLRNSADHGIESAAERVKAGKPAMGTITLEAKREKNQVLITVEDDGGGIRTDKVRAVAVKRGLLSREQADALTHEEAVSLIFTPGFSTADTVTQVSGRGVGADAVRAKVEALGGSVRIESQPGQGTRFRIRLPLTLAIIQALRVRLGKEEYMAPVTNVLEAVEYTPADLRVTHGQECVMLRDELLPVLRLARLLEVPDATGVMPGVFTVLVAESGERRVGLLVEEVLGQQEIAIKSLGKALKGIRGFGGVTVLGDGTVCLILDLPSLIEG